jgi:hypothetical protein
MREPAINCGHLQVLCVEFTGPGQGIKAINRSEHWRRRWWKTELQWDRN